MIKAIIVDDEQNIIDEILYLLDWKNHGVEIVGCASDVYQALHLVEKLHPDIVFSDIKMPQMNGIELLKKVKKRFPNMIFVVISAYSDFDYARECIKFGAFAYLLKTVDKNEMLEVIERAKALQTSDFDASEKQEEDKTVAEKIKRFIHENFEKEISLSKLSKKFFVSTNHLNSLFKREYGITINRFIIHVRMNKAAELIKQNRLTLTQIGQAVGYDDYYYFSRLFKKFHHVSPTQYSESFKTFL